MIWLRLMVVGWVVSVCGPVVVCAGDEASGRVESLIRVMNSDVRRIDQRLVELDRELEPLPPLRERTYGSRFGHHSGPLATETESSWVMIDLQQTRPVDMVSLVPVYVTYLGKEGEGYGFPKRFKIEVADNPEMEGAVTVIDRSNQDVLNPGRYPMTWEFDAVEGRYVKLTALKHCRGREGFFWAMEEMMVLSGNLNVGSNQKMEYSSGMDLFPQWVGVRIMDGQSALGMPVDVTDASPTQGYLSADARLSNFEMNVQGRPTGFEHKWVAVDLGDEQEIEQVCLLPLESDEYEVVGGRGFPRQMMIQMANDPGFEDLVYDTMCGTNPLGYPAGCPFIFQIPGVKARYVRVVPIDMWTRDDYYRFGFAELQVISNGLNVALGKLVWAKDQSDKPRSTGWAPEFLVDGYTSQYRVIEWPEYLELIARRTELANERRVLLAERFDKLSTGRRLLYSGVMAILVVMVSGWAWAVIRGRVLRQRELSQLRDQIARDLHDDIGSNLGGIVLLSEIGSEQSADADSRQDFRSIRRAAEDASVAMRDIVWLIQREPVGLKDFVFRMREAVRMLLKDVEVSLVIEPEEFDDRPLGLLFRRHMFFAFKEVLNNVRKHASTGRAEVRIEIDKRFLRFTVRDEGIGFDPSIGGAGHGMGNLKRRASRLSGRFDIESKRGQGTIVKFHAPYST